MRTDVMISVITRDIKDDTAAIRNDTAELKLGQEQLELGQEQILAKIAELQSQLPLDIRENSSANFGVQRYLDSLTTYTGSVSDHLDKWSESNNGQSSRGSSPSREHGKEQSVGPNGDLHPGLPPALSPPAADTGTNNREEEQYLTLVEPISSVSKVKSPEHHQAESILAEDARHNEELVQDNSTINTRRKEKPVARSEAISLNGNKSPTSLLLELPERRNGTRTPSVRVKVTPSSEDKSRLITEKVSNRRRKHNGRSRNDQLPKGDNTNSDQSYGTGTEKTNAISQSKGPTEIEIMPRRRRSPLSLIISWRDHEFRGGLAMPLQSSHFGLTAPKALWSPEMKTHLLGTSLVTRMFSGMTAGHHLLVNRSGWKQSRML